MLDVWFLSARVVGSQRSGLCVNSSSLLCGEGEVFRLDSNRGHFMCLKITHSKRLKGAPLFASARLRLHQTTLSRHTSCTRTRRGAQRLPENSGSPSPLIDAAISLSLPHLLACICRSMRLQRMAPIGSSSEVTPLALWSCRAASMALTMAPTRHAPSCPPPLVPCMLRRCTSM